MPKHLKNQLLGLAKIPITVQLAKPVVVRFSEAFAVAKTDFSDSFDIRVGNLRTIQVRCIKNANLGPNGVLQPALLVNIFD